MNQHEVAEWDLGVLENLEHLSPESLRLGKPAVRDSAEAPRSSVTAAAVAAALAQMPEIDFESWCPRLA